MPSQSGPLSGAYPGNARSSRQFRDQVYLPPDDGGRHRGESCRTTRCATTPTRSSGGTTRSIPTRLTADRNDRFYCNWPYLLRIRYRLHDGAGRLAGADSVQGIWFEQVLRVDRPHPLIFSRPRSAASASPLRPHVLPRRHPCTPTSFRHARTDRRGSVLLLVVASIAMLAFLGGLFLVTTHTQRYRTPDVGSDRSATRQSDVNLVLESVHDEIARQIKNDVFNPLDLQAAQRPGAAFDMAPAAWSRRTGLG